MNNPSRMSKVQRLCYIRHLSNDLSNVFGTFACPTRRVNPVRYRINARGLPKDGRGIHPRFLDGTPVPQRIQERFRGLSVDVLHAVIVHPAFTSNGIDRNDVGMMQARCGLSLGMKPRDLVGIEDRCERQHLEGNASLKRLLTGEIDDPHASASNFPKDLEIA